MSDLIYQFSQSAHPGTLTNLMQGVRGIAQQVTARKAEEQRQIDLAAAREAAMASGNDPQAWSNYMNLANPEEMKNITEQWGLVDKAYKDNMITNFGKLHSGLLNDPTGIGVNTLEDFAKAAEENPNAFKGMDADDFRGLAEGIKSGDPKAITAAQGMIAGFANSIPGYKEAVGDSMYAFSQEKRAEESHASDQIMTTANIMETLDGMGVESIEERARIGAIMETMPLSQGRRLAELIPIVGATNVKDMTPSQFASLVTTLRTEYFDDTAGYRENDLLKSKMQSSLAQDSSQGDIGALYLFMKMLDENSVVRESEFKTASNMGSAYDSLRNTMDSWVTGQRLQPGQKEDLNKLINEFYRISAEKRKPIDERMWRNTAFFGVPRNLVDLEYPDNAEESVPLTGAVRTNIPSNPAVTGNMSWLDRKRAAVKAANPQSKQDFSTMTNEQLNQYKAGRAFGDEAVTTAQPTTSISNDVWDNAEED